MKKNLTKLSALVALAFLAGSCKKNDSYNNGTVQTSVELPLAAYAGPAAYDSGGFIYGITDSISATPQPLSTLIYISADKPLSKSVTVTLAVDNAAITRVNAAHKALYLSDSTAAVQTASTLPDPADPKYTIYIALPANAYAAQGTTVTIPAGQLRANYTVNIISANLTYGASYMLPISITDAGGQKISYYKSVYYTVGLKSAYEGDYTANGSISFPNPASNRSWVNRDKPLTTVSGNTVHAEAADLGGSNYFMNLTVNADNTVTVQSAPGAANQTIQNNGQCTYDPSSKTFTLNYKYVGGTGDRHIAETIHRNN
ncbi:DUF1735 domain-containing protein [Mucilaginibacter sp. BJC16-A38]|uniref:BT_3044 domain-containing protein n=1 Tax=Mucilaginibacter phenanthrenivorans TaxID=1234842 RepID=UPI0021580A7C|nr:DUF4361 domain-containing protein [Mucilaginibacter phenanthrenivorans]MCR8560130.1 DUF1735 domain-containing protein [Mucilaginibacter phenanthrenivorans]